MLVKAVWRFIASNLVWKLLSLTFAVIIWFVVVNYTNPLETGRFRVPLSIINENTLTDNNFLVFNRAALETTIIDMHIRAPRSLIEELSNDPSLLSAFIDLEPIDFSHTALLGEPLPITVRYSLPSTAYEVQRYSPDRVSIIFDRYESRTFPILIDYTGDVPDGYSSAEATLNPQTVVISGARSTINDIASVRVTLDRTEITTTTTLTKNLVVFNDLDREITDRLELSTTTTEVTLPVSRVATISVGAPRIIGQPAYNFFITSVTHSPRSIEVVGAEEVLDSISNISFDINISGISQTTNFTVDTRPMLLEHNLNVRNFSPYIVTVAVAVERLATKELTVPYSRIVAVGTSLPYSFEEEYVQITIRGPAGVLELIDEENIDLYVDMTGEGEGRLQRFIRASLPVHAEIYGEPPIVTVLLGEDEDEDEDEE